MWILDELKNKKAIEDSFAIIHRDSKITYRDLWDHSEKIAHWMEVNLNTDAPVLIYGNKDIEIVIVMIAALKTGRAYVPIDVTFPIDRVRKIAEITDAEVLFDMTNEREFINELKMLKKVIDKSSIKSIIRQIKIEKNIDESKWVKDIDNCYILFTSGSTGEPKGVQISKNNIINFVDWFCKYADVAGQVVLNQVSYSFDVSVIQLYIYLSLGKTLFCIDKDMVSDFGSLFQFLGSSNISAWVSTPAFIEMCAVYDVFDRKLLSGLKKVILAGEVLTKKLVAVLWEKFPGIEVINGYGPTEGTVLLTCCSINNEMMNDSEHELPIGYILDGGKYLIDFTVDNTDGESLDKNDEKGELVVSSKSISRGYYKNPEATRNNFFTDKEGQLFYRTGDIVYETDDLIYYCGRKDYQVKLNGYRIELDDISENINKIDCISNNVVLPVYRDGRIAYIAAFVSLNRDLALSASKTSIYIRKKLSYLIPSYMIPKKIIALDKFPLNVNGKIDRKLLRDTYL